MGSAIGVERGCQAYCFDCSASGTGGKLPAADGAESGMHSRSAASTVSGCGVGSASSSNDALAVGRDGAIATGAENGVGVNSGRAVADSRSPEDAAAGLAACPLRSNPRATRSVPLDCST